MNEQDQKFLEQVRDLVRIAKMAIEEADSYAEDIHDPVLKKQAQDLLDSI